MPSQKKPDEQAEATDAPVTTTAIAEGDDRAADTMSTPDSAINPATREPQQPGPRSATITLEDAQIDVDVEGDGGDEPEAESIRDLSTSELQDLQRRVLQESAVRGTVVNRPFRELDTESLLVLSHAVQAEIASR